MNPSVDSQVTCTANLAGTDTDVATALSGAFTSKPLILNLTKTSSDIKLTEEKKSSISLYPNPSVKGITISGVSGFATVTIFDLNGSEVQKSIVSDKSTINTDALPKGSYIAKISTSNKTETVKLIKK